jgi:nicotinamidase-related amidase
MDTLELTTAREYTIRDKHDCTQWKLKKETVTLNPAQSALLICDMWDRHWAKGATLRVGELAPRVNELAAFLREKGLLIIHAASDTMDFYKGHPARERFLSTVVSASASHKEDGETIDVKEHPLPIDDSDQGSDTGEGPEMAKIVWTRENEKIAIDSEKDIIAGDEGEKIRAYLRFTGRNTILFAGVHTNMCILTWRTFGMVPMLRRGFQPILLESYTDAMYNPLRPPYVAHEEGTRLVCSYVRKFYAPTSDFTVPLGWSHTS